jgi:hypothetical protein
MSSHSDQLCGQDFHREDERQLGLQDIELLEDIADLPLANH